MPNYVLDHFLVNGAPFSGSNQIQVKMSSSEAVTAVYKPEIVSQLKFNVNHSNGGRTNPPPGDYYTAQGTKMVLTATANRGHRFKYWLIDSVRYTTPQVTITINHNGWAWAQF